MHKREDNSTVSKNSVIFSVYHTSSCHPISLHKVRLSPIVSWICHTRHTNPQMDKCKQNYHFFSPFTVWEEIIGMYKPTIDYRHRHYGFFYLAKGDLLFSFQILSVEDPGPYFPSINSFYSIFCLSPFKYRFESTHDLLRR